MGEKEQGVARESSAPSISERAVAGGQTDPTPAQATAGAPLKGVDVKLG